MTRRSLDSTARRGCRVSADANNEADRSRQPRPLTMGGEILSASQPPEAHV